MTQLSQAVAGVTPGGPADQVTPSTSAVASADSNRLVSGAESLARTVSELGQMAVAGPSGVAATSPGTSTRGQSTATNDSGGGASVSSIATTFLESGFGIIPLITGLIGLFSGGSTAPSAPEKYTMPSSISFESAETPGGLTAADFDQTGAARLYNYSAGSPGTVDSSDDASSPSSPAPGGGAAAPQVTVNVQAMDAQSFMDYSSQIAQAVRGAMLNLSSLNDVVNEL
ncbi:MAG: hypothetical protein P4L56_11345 [Candidatus Sulfopaludibacter sp.]|nr:hypothetical protein [Candidatus Sulfopaludibacter sp.]